MRSSSATVSNHQIENTDVASPSALMMSSMLNDRTAEIKDNLLKRSYDNPIFKTLIKNIKEGNIISAETALNAICIDESNKVALGYALILSLECGQATNVGDLAVHKWAENDLPRALLFMQTRASTVQTWNGPNRETIYKLLIDVLAKKTELTLEEKSKEHLQAALTYMISKWGDHLEALLNNALIVQSVNIDKLLIAAIEMGNSSAVAQLITKGASNISEALILVHSYLKKDRYGWKETNGYDIVRRCLTDALAIQPKLNSVADNQLDSITIQDYSRNISERQNIKKIVPNILESKNIMKIGIRTEELKTLMLKGNAIRSDLELEELLIRALELWHGEAAIIFAKAGARNLPQALNWLQEKYSSYGTMIEGYYRTWRSGSWVDTYRSIALIAAGDWNLVYSEAERNYGAYEEITQNNIELDESGKSVLQDCIQYMIRNEQEEALILLRAINKTGIMRDNISKEACHQLIQYAIELGNGAAVDQLLNSNYLVDEDEWCHYVSHLEKLISLSTINLARPGAKHNELVTFLADSLVIKSNVECQTPQHHALLNRLFSTIIVKGQTELFKNLINCSSINNNITNLMRHDLFIAALEMGEILIAKHIFDAKTAYGVEALGFKLNAIFYYQMHTEEISQKQLNKKIDVQFCRVITNETLHNSNLFDTTISAVEKSSLHKVLAQLINANAPELIQYIDLQHINIHLNHETLLDCAVKAPNFSFIQHITKNDELFRVRKICTLKALEHAQRKMVNTSDVNAQAELKHIRDYFLSLTLCNYKFRTDIDDIHNEDTVLFSILEEMVIAGDTEFLNDLIKQHSYIETADIDRLLDLAMSYEPGADLRKFAAIPILIERSTSKIMLAIEKMQALPIEIKTQHQNVYTTLLNKLFVCAKRLLSDEAEKLRFVSIIIKLLQLDADTQENIIIAIIKNKEIHTSLDNRFADLLLPILKTPGYEKFLIVLANHAYSDGFNVLSQFRKSLIAPVFLEAARKNQADLIAFCLHNVTLRDDLGLTGKHQESPLVLALENHAIEVIKILFQYCDVADMDRDEAIRIEMTRRNLNQQSWFGGQKVLPQDLFEKLTGQNNPGVGYRQLH